MEDIKLFLSLSKNKLMELTNENISPEKINEYMEVYLKCTSTTDDIIDFIRNKFHVEWHPNKHKYLRVENTKFPNEESMQLGYSNLESYKENFGTNTVEENKTLGVVPSLNGTTTDNKSPQADQAKNNEVPIDEGTAKMQLPESDVQPQNQCITELKKALDYLEAINKTVRKLETDNRNLSNRLTTIENLLIEDNPIQKANNLADDMIKIYASENSKKNVNINPVINDRVLELMKSKFNIQNNNAQAINTALLIALYKSNIDEKVEK